MSKLPRSSSTFKCFLALVLHLGVLYSEGMNNRVPVSILPTEAASKGVSQTVVGVINSVFNLSRCICTIPLMMIITPKRTKLFFILGSVTAGLFCALFGELIRIQSTDFFVWSCIITRFVMGIGTTMIWASMTSLALSLFPHHQGTMLALIQLAIALGELVGSPLTSLLYAADGYSLPYLVTGLMQCSLAIMYFYFFPSPKELTKKACEDPSTNLGMRSSIFKFIFCPGILITSLPLLFVTVFLGFLCSAFAPYLLEEFQIDQTTAGLYFIPYSLADMGGALFIAKLVDKGCSGPVYCGATFVHTLAVLGSSLPMFFMKLTNMIFMQIMLALTGMSLAAHLTSVIPIYDKISQIYDVDSQAQIKIFCSSWMGLIVAFGQLLGQGIFGGLFYEMLQFYPCCFMQSGFGVLAFLLTFCYLIRHGLFWHPGSKFSEVKVDSEEMPLIKSMKHHDEIVQSNHVKEFFKQSF